MPKGKKEKSARGKRPGSGRLQGPDDLNSEFDDRESLNDLDSVTSSQSGIASLGDGSEKEHEEFDALDEKVKEAIDGLYEKSAQGRTGFLQFMLKTCQARIVTDVLMERSETLTDSIERCLRKGKGPEQGAAAQLAAAAMLQLGDEGSSYLFKAMHPVMLCLVADASVPAAARAKIASSLGLLTFICGENADEFALTMKTLETVFGAAYCKSTGPPPSFGPDMFGLISAALASWTLLVSILSPGQCSAYVNTHLPRLPGLLDSTDLELRITGGEAIALFYEIMREHDENFEMELHDDLCDKLRQLATDSQKFRAKKDRKAQRFSFREILKTVEENEYPLQSIKFGREVLLLDSWTRKLQYERFCDLLGPGTNLHLSSNELFRDIFSLGPVIPTAGVNIAKLSKMDRHLGNMAAFKARTVARSKTRDKRSYDIVGDY